MASTAERTYSFRASPELASRLAQSRAQFSQLATQGPDVEVWLARELEMALARRLRDAPGVVRDQSAFIRTAVELLVGVTEKVATGLELSAAYANARDEDHEADAFSRGATQASLPSWRQE